MRIVLLSILCACAAVPSRPAAPAAEPLADLNRISRAAYASARTRALAAAGPALIVGPSHITLVQGAARSELELAPPRYHDLKSISHLALGMHGLHLLNQPQPAQVAELRDAAQRALAALDGRGLTREQIDRQREIVKIMFDDTRPLADRQRAAGPLLLANALDAARAEIDDLDAAVKSVRATLGDGAFARLHVIVVGAHMAREGEIAMQYFERTLGEREGLKLVFAEGVWDEPGELQLLGTHLIDASVGEAFFGDPRRMHRDLLADAAAQVLSERSGK